MSTILMAACWPLKMSPAQKIVLMSLADQANDDGVCWPGVQSMTVRTCLSERAVRSALGWLERARVVVRDFRPNQTTNYVVRPHAFSPPETLPKAPRKAAQKPGAARAGGAGNAPGGAPAAPGGAANAPALADAAPLGVQELPPNRKGTVIRTVSEPPRVTDTPAPLFDLPEAETLPIPKTRTRSKAPAASSQAWRAYAEAYAQRYGAAPIENERSRSQMAQFVRRVPLEEAPEIARFFVSLNRRFYVEKQHPIGLLLQDAESIRTQWFTGRTMTTTRAAQMDRGQANYDAVAEAMDILDRKGAFA